MVTPACVSLAANLSLLVKHRIAHKESKCRGEWLHTHGCSRGKEKEDPGLGAKQESSLTLSAVTKSRPMLLL